MTPTKIRLQDDPHGSSLRVDGVGTIQFNEAGDGFIGSSEVVAAAGLTQLRNALARYEKGLPPPGRHGFNPVTGEMVSIRIPVHPARVRVQVVDVPQSKFEQKHSYEFVPEPVEIVLVDTGALAVSVEFTVVGEEEPEPNLLCAPLKPLLERTGAKIYCVEQSPEGTGALRSNVLVTNADFWIVTVFLTLPVRGRDSAWALKLGEDALTLLEAAEAGSLSRASALDLIRAGRAELLVGLTENAWLEAKEQLYPKSDWGKMELAKDASALANSPTGGLIVIGLKTRKLSDSDVVTKVKPVHGDPKVVDRYRKWLNRWIYPRISDLQIESSPYGEHEALVTISVPPQPAALAPFLVRGVLKEGKLRGTHLAMFTRVDDAVLSSGIEEIHALLLAGRAALGHQSGAATGPEDAGGEED